ncbi:YitT family protein [Lactobacillus jensenii]|uniref:YitT family protein n=1 Tax=Lactobacillus jensenii TaxID=109790 RepID=UPI001F093E33|nr:YitT family protein [Lactobacillus jensenii]
MKVIKPKFPITPSFIIELIMIALGSAIYGLSINMISIPNQLTDGGLSGISLLLFHWWKVNLGFSTIILNIPLILIDFRFLGKKLMIETLWGTICLAFFLNFWRLIPIINQLNLEHDLLLAAISAGLLSGLGLGIVFRYNGTIGGSDIIARILQQEKDIKSGKTFFIIDVIVLVLSLSYIDIRHIMYTLIASYIATTLIDIVQQGGNKAKAVFIISDKYEEIAKMIDLELDRGFSFLNGEGGFDRSQKHIIYCIVANYEIQAVKAIVLREDPKAFMTIFDANEALGEGMSYNRKKRNFFIRR